MTHTEERARGARAELWRLAGPWWLLLITGIAWLIISVMVLRFRLSSITTVRTRVRTSVSVRP